MIVGDLPPSSSDRRFRLPCAATSSCLPTAVEPVNAILSTSGCSASSLSEHPPAARNDIDRSRRDAGLEQLFSEQQHRQGRQLRGFQHDRASRGECGCQLPRRGHQRAVPRDDLAHDPDRLVTHVAVKIDSGDGGLEQLAVEFRAPAGVVAERLCSVGHFVLERGGVQLAAVEAFQLGKLHGRCFDQLRHAPQKLLTVRRRQTSPATVVEALARRSHGIVQVRFAP